MKDEKQSGWDIRERTLEYSLRAVRLYQTLQNGKDGAGWEIGKQYFRSASSIGANVAEALSAESRADFIHKYSIAQKEARESLYWLRLLEKSAMMPRERLLPLMQETEELIAVITTIIVNAKRKRSNEG